MKCALILRNPEAVLSHQHCTPDQHTSSSPSPKVFGLLHRLGLGPLLGALLTLPLLTFCPCQGNLYFSFLRQSQKPTPPCRGRLDQRRALQLFLYSGLLLPQPPPNGHLSSLHVCKKNEANPKSPPAPKVSRAMPTSFLDLLLKDRHWVSITWTHVTVPRQRVPTASETARMWEGRG